MNARPSELFQEPTKYFTRNVHLARRSTRRSIDCPKYKPRRKRIAQNCAKNTARNTRLLAFTLAFTLIRRERETIIHTRQLQQAR